jgi:lipoyl-dependent peroxiredoxin
MKRTASAEWSGSGKDGEGSLSTPSGALDEMPYSFHTRFENGDGTNPEELIAAAHAGCFTMALAFALEKAGFEAENLDTNATLTMDKTASGWEISAVHLELNAEVPEIDNDAFQEIAADAKANCPVSKLLKCEITLEATLDNSGFEDNADEDDKD